MKNVAENLYVGTVSEAAKHEKNILNLSEQCMEPKKDSAYVHIPIRGDDTELIKRVIRAGSSLTERGDTAVVCNSGLSKSSAVSAAIMSLENFNLIKENIEKIRFVQSGANPQEDLIDSVRESLYDMDETQDF